jgi:hypothetical protein
MQIFRMVVKEIVYRRLNFALGVLSIGLAAGILAGAMTMLRVHDIQTDRIIEAKQKETEAAMADLDNKIREATLKLGFNLVIFPKDLDLSEWYTEGYGTSYMPEEYVTKLATSNIVTVRHLLPSLQQKVKWPEKKRTVILIGTRGEIPDMHKSPVQTLAEAVPAGTIVLGFELHNSMGITEGERVTFMGREFSVHKCHEERGGQDDFTVWLHLSEVQELLDKEGKINAILALECACAWADVEKVRAELGAILPDTQIKEMGSKALARAEARISAKAAKDAEIAREKKGREDLKASREGFASKLVGVVMAAAMVWIFVLTFNNVRERRNEIGILRAIGMRSGQILIIFLSKSVAMGFLGGLLGVAAGVFGGLAVGGHIEHMESSGVLLASIFNFKSCGMIVVLAGFLSVVASWIPSMMAAGQDPAEILQKE